MQIEFLKNFFPCIEPIPWKINHEFYQKDVETFYHCWEWFKNVLNACLHHGNENWMVISFFYEVATKKKKTQFIETMCNDEFFNKDPEEAFVYFDYLDENAQSWDVSNLYDRFENKKCVSGGGKYHFKEVDDEHARLVLMYKRLQSLEFKKVNEIHVLSSTIEKCNISKDPEHVTNVCPIILSFTEILFD